MIDIIIPVYNAHETLTKTLLSVAMQNLKDKVTVYLIDDCSKKGYKEFIKLFKNKLKIKYLKLKTNSGPGIARQYGIEQSKGEYILFLDSDDLLYDCFSLENIYNVISNNDSDLAIGTFIDERENEYVEYYAHVGCLHGKMYKREFIKNNNIHFNNTRSSEDNSFNRLVLLFNPKIVFTRNIISLYRNNKDSITQKNNYEFNSLEWYIYNMIWTIEIGEQHSCDKDKIADLIYSASYYIYSRYLFFINRDDSRKILLWFKPMVRYVKEYSNALPEESKKKLYSEYFYQNPVKISFFQFLDLSELMQ
jgi:Glycosyltransferases involved in cell wall biogenesis